MHFVVWDTHTPLNAAAHPPPKYKRHYKFCKSIIARYVKQKKPNILGSGATPGVLKVPTGFCGLVVGHHSGSAQGADRILRFVGWWPTMSFWRLGP